MKTATALLALLLAAAFVMAGCTGLGIKRNSDDDSDQDDPTPNGDGTKIDVDRDVCLVEQRAGFDYSIVWLSCTSPGEATVTVDDCEATWDGIYGVDAELDDGSVRVTIMDASGEIMDVDTYTGFTETEDVVLGAGTGFTLVVTLNSDMVGAFYVGLACGDLDGQWYEDLADESEQFDDACASGFNPVNTLMLDVGTYTRNGFPECGSDWFSFALQSSATVSLSTSVSLGDDSVMKIYDVDGYLIDSNDDCPTSSGLGSCWESTLWPGTFYVAVSGYQGESVGSYSISYSTSGGEVADRDGDGVPDSRDNCSNTYNPDQSDTDYDSVGDACDTFQDYDGDGVQDGVDNCMYDYNPNQADSDADGYGDACDYATDSDYDGVSDDWDNCTYTYNPDQADDDGDGQGNACDTSVACGDYTMNTNTAVNLNRGSYGPYSLASCDWQWYAFYSSGENLSVYIDGSDSSGDDPVMDIYDSYGNWVAGDDDCDVPANYGIGTYDPCYTGYLSADTYYLVVHGYDGESLASYYVNIFA